MSSSILVYQAKSFYNAYIALEQINRADDQGPLLIAPIIVNGAFSVELALKAILEKNQIEYGKEHNLFVLYSLLPESFQSELFNHLVEKAPEYENAKKCFDELVLISNAFVDWRYVYEDNPTPAFDIRFLSAFANAAIWTMLSHYNGNFVPVTDTTETDEEIERLFEENRAECIDANLKKIKKKLKKGN